MAFMNIPTPKYGKGPFSQDTLAQDMGSIKTMCN